MRIVFMGGPVPVPVLEERAYARADAAGVNARPAIQPTGGMRSTRRDRGRFVAGTATLARRL
ncbi:hypothetical protein XarbCFBP8142_15705 [Xanthomonas arboricola]|nr:hypothetical protein XarbCFBP8142_15705 [Xanthomonas arboricola]